MDKVIYHPKSRAREHEILKRHQRDVNHRFKMVKKLAVRKAGKKRLARAERAYYKLVK